MDILHFLCQCAHSKIVTVSGIKEWLKEHEKEPKILTWLPKSQIPIWCPHLILGLHNNSKTVKNCRLKYKEGQIFAVLPIPIMSCREKNLYLLYIFYNSGAGGGRHRSVSMSSGGTNQQLWGVEFFKGRCSPTSCFPHTLSHLESLPVLLHSTAHGGAPAGVLQPHNREGTVIHCGRARNRTRDMK